MNSRKLNFGTKLTKPKKLAAPIMDIISGNLFRQQVKEALTYTKGCIREAIYLAMQRKNE